MRRIRIFFAWYDLWIGAYLDRKSRALYICPLPCVVIRIDCMPSLARRRARLGCLSAGHGGPTDAELAAGCDCQRPHGAGVRGISMECPIHG